MIRIFAPSLSLVLVACAASAPTVRPNDPAGASAASGQADPSANGPGCQAPKGEAPHDKVAKGDTPHAGGPTEAPCAGKSGRDLVDCKKSQKGVKTKFLFKSGGGLGAGAADVGDDDDDDDE